MKCTELNYAYLSAVNMYQQWTKKEHENKSQSSQISAKDMMYYTNMYYTETSTTDTRLIFNERFISLQANWTPILSNIYWYTKKTRVSDLSKILPTA